MNLNEYERNRQQVYYHIDGLNHANCWENIANPGKIGWAAGVAFHRCCVEVASNTNSKYDCLRLTCDTNEMDEPAVLAIWNKVSI